MPTVPLGRSLQENLITLLCHHEHGKIVAHLADPGLFEGDYALIAAAAVDYWRQFQTAPKAHTADLFAAEIERGGRQATALKRTLLAMAQLAEQLNADYVINQLQEFTKKQLLKDAVLKAAELLSRDDGAIEEVETVMAEVLKAQHAQYDSGTRLDDELEPFLDRLALREAEFITGIKPLDDAGIVPARGQIMLLIGGKGRGKSWFLTNVGRHALMRRKRVLHVSLEMDEADCRLRYYQALFSVPRRAVRSRDGSPGRVDVKRLQFDPRQRAVTAIHSGTVVPVFSFASTLIRQELETRIVQMGGKAANLIIKRFPNRTLSIDGLDGYLDMLAATDNFVPDIVCLDYARLMKIPMRSTGDYRIGIGHNMEMLRALAIRRNFALVTADQLNRIGNDKRQARSTMVGEDWSQVTTADICITHSATDAERRDGLCRLYVDHARTERDKIMVLLAQALDIGQFCMQAAHMPEDYFERLMPGDAAERADAAVDRDQRAAFAPADMMEVED